jgi:CheY-like chemotaxis protein
MPEMDGLAVLEHLQRDAGTLDIPVIMLSASVVSQRKVLEMGARYFLQKPCDPGVLCEALKSALRPDGCRAERGRGS